MSFAIAAAGTGGHVFPGLAVGEALVSMGVSRHEILFVGGERLEASIYPTAGFPFFGVELVGLQRRFTAANLRIPVVVRRAVNAMTAEFRARGVRSALGLGGYVTVPAGFAARRAGARWAVAEQNAGAGLANRMTARWATRVFGSFPTTDGLPTAEWVGNPLRRPLARFDREAVRSQALQQWELDPELPVVGVFGGSLGAGVVNQAVMSMMADWAGPDIQLLHLAGQGKAQVDEAASVSPARWVVLDFCDEMDRFYAACDLIVARAGGSVAELLATSTPAILIPGRFGSGGHQAANAAALAAVGAALVVEEEAVGGLGTVVAELAASPSRRGVMAAACAQLARPEAASVIAGAMVEMATA